MLEFDLTLILPSYMCNSRYFESFVEDLSKSGFNKVIILHDFDFSTSDVLTHKKSIKVLKKNITPFFKSQGMKFKIITNALLEPKIYSIDALSCISDVNSRLYFLTIPLSSDQSIAMRNIFTLKNAGYSPVINCFEDVSVMFKKSFCEALLTTENISFIFDADLICNEKVNSYVNKSLSSENTVLFSVNHFTVSVIERSLSGLWDKLTSSKRMSIGYLSQKFSNYIFK